MENAQVMTQAIIQGAREAARAAVKAMSEASARMNGSPLK